MTTVASLTAEISLANKNIVSELQDSPHIYCLLGKYKLGGCTSEKTGTGGALRGIHYCWLYGYDSGHPRLKCSDNIKGHVMNATRANMQGVLEKNKLAFWRIGQEYIANKLSNVNCSDVPVNSQGCIDSGYSTHCSENLIIVTVKVHVIHVLYVGQTDATTMISTHTAYLPLPQLYVSS